MQNHAPESLFHRGPQGHCPMKEFGKVPGLGLLFLGRMQTSSVPLRPTSPVWSRRTETNEAVLTSVLHIKKNLPTKHPGQSSAVNDYREKPLMQHRNAMFQLLVLHSSSFRRCMSIACLTALVCRWSKKKKQWEQNLVDLFLSLRCGE